MSKEYEDGEEYLNFAQKKTKKGWWPYGGHKVGKVKEDGSVSGTDYKFKREIRGGVAVSSGHRTVYDEETDTMQDGAGGYYERTKKGTGFWDTVRKQFIRPYMKRGEDGEREQD